MRLKMQADCVECHHKTSVWASSSRWFFVAGTRQISRGLEMIFLKCGQFNSACCNSSEIGPRGVPLRAYLLKKNQTSERNTVFGKKQVLKNSISSKCLFLWFPFLLHVLLKCALLGSHVRIGGIFLYFSASRSNRSPCATD